MLAGICAGVLQGLETWIASKSRLNFSSASSRRSRNGTPRTRAIILETRRRGPWRIKRLQWSAISTRCWQRKEQNMPKVTVEQHRRFRDLLRKNIYPQQVTSVFRTHLLSFSETILECAADALADQIG